jgi:hypothetical protein
MLTAFRNLYVLFVFQVPETAFQHFKNASHKIVVAVFLLKQVVGKFTIKLFPVIGFTKYLLAITADIDSDVQRLAFKLFKFYQVF